MAGDLIEHMVEKGKTRRQIALAIPIEVEGNDNLRFQRISGHLRASRSHSCFLPSRRGL